MPKESVAAESNFSVTFKSLLCIGHNCGVQSIKNLDSQRSKLRLILEIS